MENFKSKIDEEMAYIGQNKRLLGDLRHISFSEYARNVKNDKSQHYLIFFYDPSSDLQVKAYNIIFELNNILSSQLNSPPVELVAYDLSLTRLPRRFRQDKNFLANSLYFVEKLTKKLSYYDEKGLSGNGILDFVLINLSKSGWRYGGNIDEVQFTEEQK